MNPQSIRTRLAGVRKHVGKQQQKWQFHCHVCDVRGLPDDVSRAVVVWDRGKRAMMTQSVDVQNGYARWDAELTQKVTLFRSAKTGALDPKLCKLQVYDADRMNVGQLSSGAGLLASIQIDLAQYSLAGEAAAGAGKIAQLSLQSELGARSGARQRSLKPGAGLASAGSGQQGVVMLQINLRGMVSSGADDDDDDDASSVHSGSTVTARDAHSRAGYSQYGSSQSHETIDDGASTVYDDDRPLRKGIEIEGSQGPAVPAWARRGGGKALAEAQARVLTLEQQLASAQAQVSALESTIGILRHRLDVEVLEDISATLERAAGARTADAARMYCQQLCATSERLQALITGDATLEPGGGAAEREVVVLRRELARDKIRLAELTFERDEYKHLMSRLGVQGMGLPMDEAERVRGQQGRGLLGSIGGLFIGT